MLPLRVVGVVALLLLAFATAAHAVRVRGSAESEGALEAEKPAATKSPVEDLVGRIRRSLLTQQVDANDKYNQQRSRCAEEYWDIKRQLQAKRAQLDATNDMLPRYRRRINKNTRNIDEIQTRLNRVKRWAITARRRLEIAASSFNDTKQFKQSRATEIQRIIGRFEGLRQDSSLLAAPVALTDATQQAKSSTQDPQLTSFLEEALTMMAPTDDPNTYVSQDSSQNARQLLDLVLNELNQHLTAMDDQHSKQVSAFNELQDELRGSIGRLRDMAKDLKKARRRLRKQNKRLLREVAAQTDIKVRTTNDIALLKDQLSGLKDSCRTMEKSYREQSLQRRTQLETLHSVQAAVSTKVKPTNHKLQDIRGFTPPKSGDIMKAIKQFQQENPIDAPTTTTEAPTTTTEAPAPAPAQQQAAGGSTYSLQVTLPSMQKVQQEVAAAAAPAADARTAAAAVVAADPAAPAQQAAADAAAAPAAPQQEAPAAQDAQPQQAETQQQQPQQDAAPAAAPQPQEAPAAAAPAAAADAAQPAQPQEAHDDSVTVNQASDDLEHDANDNVHYEREQQDSWMMY